MSVGDALRSLAALVDAVDELGAEVVEAQPGEIDDDEFVADVRLRVPLDGGLTAADCTARGAAAGPERAENADDIEQPEAHDDSARTDTAADAMEPSDVYEGLAVAAPTRMDERGDRNEPDETGDAVRPGESDDGDPADEATEEDVPVEAGKPADPEETARTNDPEKSDVTAETDADQRPGPSADDQVVCTFEGCSARFDSEHGMRIHRSKAHDRSAAYRDPEALATVYEEHDSFAAMREALGVDVSAQTVRKQMIEHGIHTPNRSTAYRARGDSRNRSPSEGSEQTGGEGAGADEANEANEANGSESDPSDDTTDIESGTVDDSPDAEEAVGLDGEAPDDSTAGDEGAGDHDVESGPTEVSETDTDSSSDPESTSGSDPESTSGSDPESDGSRDPELAETLPSAVTPAELRDAVQAATTLYEVQKRLGLDREETRRLLADLDLLELVHGRVADQPRREELKAELDDRLGSASRPAESSSV